jgi:general secretion pathway protein D
MLQPEPANVAPGGVIQLWVSIRGGVDVRGVPFHVWYDPRRVAFQGAREGAFLASAGNTTFMTSASDATGRLMVGYSLLGSGKGVSGQGTLCVLTFQALAPGTASFTFSNASVRSTTQGVQQASFVPATVQIR